MLGMMFVVFRAVRLESQILIDKRAECSLHSMPAQRLHVATWYRV